MIYLCKQKEIVLTDEDILNHGCLGSRKASGIGDCKSFVCMIDPKNPAINCGHDSITSKIIGE